MKLKLNLNRKRQNSIRKPQAMKLAILLGLPLIWPAALHAQAGFQVVTGKAFESAVPKDFYLEGNAIPVEKRNTVLLNTPVGARVLVGLIDTTGYSSQIQQKYIGMLIAEAPVAACSIDLQVGSYGFGLQKPAAQGQGSANFLVYNQAGKQLGNCSAQADEGLKQPRPLQVTKGSDATATLCLGRYCIALRSKE